MGPKFPATVVRFRTDNGQMIVKCSKCFREVHYDKDGKLIDGRYCSCGFDLINSCYPKRELKMSEAKKALIIVDVQNDFCPGGALPVPKGDEVVPVINRILASREFDYVAITLDWHLDDHCSFVENGGKWPKHCEACTKGADLHPCLKLDGPEHHLYIAKGFQPRMEAYSGFQGNINLVKVFNDLGIKQVYICGLATDYCVKATALDAQKAGFETFVIIDACRGVAKETSDAAIEEMKAVVGIKIIYSQEII